MDYLILSALIIASYLLGNISVARIIAKAKNFDITKSGSGNPGATNMLRTYSFGWGLLTLVLDMLKGAVPALAGFLIFGGVGGGVESTFALYACGLGAIIGHIWPIFYKFKGGKGVSTTIGVFAVANPLLTLIIFVVAFIFVLIFEYVSLASLLIVTTLSVVEFLRVPLDTDLTLAIVVRILIAVIFVLIWIMHRTNLYRLFMGKENKANLKKSLKKIGKKKNSPEPIEQNETVEDVQSNTLENTQSNLTKENNNE